MMLNIEGPGTIYLNARNAIRLLRLRLLCVIAPMNLLMFTMMSVGPKPLDDVTNVLRWCLLAEIPLLYLMVSKMLARQKKPILSLSPSGITVDMQCSRAGYLRWNEIKNVYVYNLGFFPGILGFRMVGITLHEPRKIYARIGLKRSLAMRLNDVVAPLYRPFRIRVAPISFSQEYLPMSADELLIEIQTYRATYS